MARFILLLVALALTAAFAALNWTAFTTPSALYLGLTTVQAPVGVIMLCILGAVCAGFVAWIVWLQGTVLIESRRQSRELQAQRELADRAEASRFTELRTFLTAELERYHRGAEEGRTLLMTRIAELEQRQRVMTEETGNSLSAYIGSLEDRLEHRTLPAEAVRSEPRY